MIDDDLDVAGLGDGLTVVFVAAAVMMVIGAVVVGKVREGDDSYGFNAATEKYEDLIAAGVIDPAKVTRTALQNAASIAGLMLTTEAMIADAPDEKAEAGGMPGGMGGMGMGM